MEQKTQGIVLRTVKYGDGKLIIDLLTHEQGRTSAVWRINTSRQTTVHRQLFQPLSLLELDLSQGRASQLPIVKDARFAVPYTSIPFDSIKLSVAFFIAEFLCHATRVSQCDPLLYRFVRDSLIWYDAAVEGTANFHLMFMLRLSRFLGLLPDTDNYTTGAAFDLREGHFVVALPLHADVVPPSDAEHLLTLMRMKPETLHLFRLSHTERNRILDYILQFYQLHIPSFGTLKSVDILRM